MKRLPPLQILLPPASCLFFPIRSGLRVVLDSVSTVPFCSRFLSGIPPPVGTSSGVSCKLNMLGSNLRSCASIYISPSLTEYDDVSFLKDVDSRMVKTGFNPKTCYSNHLIEELVQKGRIFEARALFDGMPYKNTFSVNKMIMGYVKSGNLDEARSLFDETPNKTAVSWTMLIKGYSQKGLAEEAFGMFLEMNRSGEKADRVMLAEVLGVCNCRDAARWVVQVHSQAVKLGCDSALMLCNTLVDSYCKCGLLCQARKLFDSLRTKDAVTYNAIINGYTNESTYNQAVALFMEMLSLGFNPSHFTFSGVLTAVTGLRDLGLGRQIHSHVVKTNFCWNVYVNNSLLDLYSKSDSIAEAVSLFSEMPELDNISYNILIAGLACNELNEEAFHFFQRMQHSGFQPAMLPFPTVLSVCANLKSVEMGRQIHAQVVVNREAKSVTVSNSLIDMYAKFGDLDAADVVFQSSTDKNTISWTNMISGFTQNGFYEEALELFRQMRSVEAVPDQSTFSSVLRASASLPLLSLGKQLHSSIVRLGYMSNIFTGSALLDMYAKCGCMKESIQTFDEMPDRNIVSCNALISAYAHNGHGKAAIRFFNHILQLHYKPDSVTFLNLLKACNHSGLVQEGLHYLDSMTKIYNINPKREHYSCIIDILGRVGRLEQVKKLLSEMPFEPDEIIWSSVLNSCRIHGNQELGEHSAQKLFNLSLDDAAPFITMSNIYATFGQWGGVSKIKKSMKDQGVKKAPAYSWIELNDEIYKFSVHDAFHLQSKELRAMLDKLGQETEKEGYKPDTFIPFTI